MTRNYRPIHFFTALIAFLFEKFVSFNLLDSLEKTYRHTNCQKKLWTLSVCPLRFVILKNTRKISANVNFSRKEEPSLQKIMFRATS